MRAQIEGFLKQTQLGPFSTCNYLTIWPYKRWCAPLKSGFISYNPIKYLSIYHDIYIYILPYLTYTPVLFINKLNVFETGGATNLVHLFRPSPNPSTEFPKRFEAFSCVLELIQKSPKKRCKKLVGGSNHLEKY